MPALALAHMQRRCSPGAAVFIAYASRDSAHPEYESAFSVYTAFTAGEMFRRTAVITIAAD
jgi:hypothetical protein